MNKLLAWLVKTNIWRWFAGKYIGHFTLRTFGYPSFPMEDFFDIVDITNAKNTVYGFVSTDTKSLSSMLIRRVTSNGKFSHAGLILPGAPREFMILHMLGKGLIHQHILGLLRQIDLLAVIAVELSPDNYKIYQDRLSNIMKHRDLFKYDYEQNLDNDERLLYCSELFFDLLDGLIDDPDFKTREIFGRKVFTPDQVAKIGKVIYTNHPNLAKLT